MKNIVTAIVSLMFLYSLVVPLLFQEKYRASMHTAESDQTPEKVHEEKPLHNVKLPKFSTFKQVSKKKTAFFSFLHQPVVDENARLLALRNKVEAIRGKLQQSKSLSPEDNQFINELAKKYKVKPRYTIAQKIDELLLRVDEIPTELVLVQAANESAWGTSRFARIGLNFFGIWCYQKGCGMVPNGRDQGLKHEVAAFNSVEQAVERYMHNINSNAAYQVLRQIRAQLRAQDLPVAPEVLATGLLAYSERGSDYIIELTDMIRHNHKYFEAILDEAPAP